MSHVLQVFRGKYMPPHCQKTPTAYKLNVWIETILGAKCCIIALVSVVVFIIAVVMTVGMIVGIVVIIISVCDLHQLLDH